MDLVSLVVTVIVIGLVVGLLLWAVMSLPLIPDVIRQILKVFIVVVAALYVISLLFGHVGGMHHILIR